MIGVDTNVLIRFLTKDDPLEYEKAVRFFKARSSSSPAYLSVVALAETIWVLRRSYGFSVEELSSLIVMLMSSKALIVAGREALETKDGLVDPSLIADYLIAHLSQGAGCFQTVTFDKRAAKKVPGMELLT